MIRAFLLAVFLALLALAPAQARIGGNPPVTGFFCPEGAGTQDGCGQSALVQQGAAAAFQIGVAGVYSGLPGCWGSHGALNQISGTPTHYTINPTSIASTGQGSNIVAWNSPGCEWAVGNWTPQASLSAPINWTTNAVNIPGCTLNTSTGVGGARFLFCSGSTTPTTISGYDFCPDETGVTNDCIGIEFTGAMGTRTDQYLVNNHFGNNGKENFGAEFPFEIAIINTVGINFHITDNYIDGNALNEQSLYGQCGSSSGLACSATEGIYISRSSATGGSVEIRRNVLLNFLLRCIVFDVRPGGNFVFGENYVQGNNFRYGGDHGECFQPGSYPRAGYMDVSFNNFIQLTAMASVGEGPWPTNFGATTGSSNSLLFADHNVQIGAYVGKMPVGGVIASTGTIASGTSTLSIPAGAITGGGTLGSGALFGSCSGVGVAGTLGGTTWTPKSGQASAGPGGGWNGGSGAQQWGFDINTSAATYPVTGSISGNTLTITTPGLVNIFANSTTGSTVAGAGVTTEMITAYGTGTGGNGTYTIAGSPQTVASETLNISVPNNGEDGSWTAQTTLTCVGGTLSNNTSSRVFVDFVNGGYGYGSPPSSSPASNYSATSPVVLVNNLIDDSASYPNPGFEQRSPNIRSSAFTFTVSAVNTGTSQITVSGTVPGALAVGTIFVLNGDTYSITALGSGTGGAGTYTVNTSTGLATGTATANWAGFIDNGAGGGSYTGVAGNVLTIVAPTVSDIFLNSTVTGVGVTSATVTAWRTGTGGVGTYTISGSAQAVPLEALSGTVPNCSGAAYFNGNMSLSGTHTYAYWNSWNLTVPGSQC